MTLVIIVLITVVTVGYLASVMLETKTASSSLDQERAYGIAMVGAHQAMAKIRDALGPWDDPYKNFASINPPPFIGRFRPGALPAWRLQIENSDELRALLGIDRVRSLVNLNRQLIDGSYPIIGGSNAPSLGQMGEPAARSPQPAC